MFEKMFEIWRISFMKGSRLGQVKSVGFLSWGGMATLRFMPLPISFLFNFAFMKIFDFLVKITNF